MGKTLEDWRERWSRGKTEGAAGARALRLEQVGLFMEQEEAWCPWNSE